MVLPFFKGFPLIKIQNFYILFLYFYWDYLNLLGIFSIFIYLYIISTTFLENAPTQKFLMY